MNKADKIISNSRAEKCKILIEKSQNDESGEWKILFDMIFFLIFINNIRKNIR